MKVLFVAHSSELSGGANRSLLSIINSFSKNPNYEIEVLLPRNQGEMNDSLTAIDVKWISSPYNIIISKDTKGISGFLRTVNIWRKFIKDIFKSMSLSFKLKNSNYDLIYTNTRVVFIGAFLAKILKIPHVWHIREFIEENNLKSIYKSNDIINKYSDEIIVISHSIKNTLINKNINPEKINVVYNGIKIQKSGKNKKILEDTVNILIAGTLIPAKRQLDAVKSIKILNDRGINNLKLYIAGTDPDNNNYKKIIEDYIESSNLNNIIFLGEVKNLNSIRDMTQIELMCSSNEAFGRVTIEGMQARNILIGSNSGATPELISHGNTGFLYESGNVYDLAKQIEYVVLNMKNLEYILKNSVDLVEKSFDIEKNIKEIESLLIMQKIK